MLEAIQNISSLISQLVSFSSGTRFYDIDTPLSSDKLVVGNFVAKEEVSDLYQFHINCLSTDTHIPDQLSAIEPDKKGRELINNSIRGTWWLPALSPGLHGIRQL